MTALSPNSEVWAYIRCSSDEQADKGLSVAGQRQAIIDYANQHDLRISRFFVDEALSGSSDKREQFQEMMHLAHSSPNPPEAILLWSWSRFARDETDAMFWKASLRRQGVEIIAVDGEVPDNPEFRNIFEALIHWRDAQFLRTLSQASRRGQQALAHMGYIPSGCRPPRGYKVVFEEREIEGRKRRLRRWVQDPEVWPLVLRAWRMRLLGASYTDILRDTALYKSAGCLSTFFANTAYKGEVYFGGTLIRVPAAVTAEEWETVQSMRAPRRGRAGRQYLLSGIARCARCGAALCGSTTVAGPRNDGYERAEWRFYICSRRANKGGCDLPRIGADGLESAVLGRVLQEALAEEAIARRTAHMVASLAHESQAVESRLQVLRSRLNELGRAIQRLMDAVERVDEPGPLLQRLAQRQRERDELLEEMHRTQAQLARLAAEPEPGTLRQSLERIFREDARVTAMVLRGMIDRLIVSEHEVRIEYRR